MKKISLILLSYSISILLLFPLAASAQETTRTGIPRIALIIASKHIPEYPEANTMSIEDSKPEYNAGRDKTQFTDITDETVDKKTSSDKGGNFIVQVGAYKNIKYANEMIGKIKADYPDVFIEIEGTFNKVRIPGIKAKEDALLIMEQIHKRYKLEPFMLLAR